VKDPFNDIELFGLHSANFSFILWNEEVPGKDEVKHLNVFEDEGRPGSI
jgi:hypothetical protein